MRSYQIAGSSQKKGKDPSVYRIVIPRSMARLVQGEQFVPEWHGDGILLRRVDAIHTPPLPPWVESSPVSGGETT
jgi:hypothetical protein